MTGILRAALLAVVLSGAAVPARAESAMIRFPDGRERGILEPFEVSMTDKGNGVVEYSVYDPDPDGFGELCRIERIETPAGVRYRYIEITIPYDAPPGSQFERDLVALIARAQ